MSTFQEESSLKIEGGPTTHQWPEWASEVMVNDRGSILGWDWIVYGPDGKLFSCMGSEFSKNYKPA